MRSTSSRDAAHAGSAGSAATDPADAAAVAAVARRAALRDLVRAVHYELVPVHAESHIAELPTRASVSVTCSPTKGIATTLDLVERLVAAGHHVVPHLSARLVTSAAETALIARRIDAAGVREVFVIGGDATAPAGPYADALALMRGLLDAGMRVEAIGSAAYPEGHPAIPDRVLHQSLVDRRALLADAGVRGWVSTQMCFDAERFRTWLEATRLAGVTTPVRVGVPGPLALTKLLTLGARLGVGQSLRFLRKNRSARELLGGFDPAELLAPIAVDAPRLGIEGVHLFTFNQVAGAAAWVESALR